MIISKDKLILKQVEEFKMISVEQARLLAYPLITTGYQAACKRLHKLVYTEKRLKIIRNEKLSMNLFCDIDQNISKLPNSPHRIYLLNFYCRLISEGAKFITFQTEKKWMESSLYPQGKCRSDAIAVYSYGSEIYCNMVEVNKSNNSLDLGRFDEAVGEIKERFNNIIPKIILIDSRGHKSYNSKIFKIIRVDYNLTNFSQIFL